MMVRRLPSLIGAAVITTWGLSASVLPAAAIPSASAQPCPDTEVVFARGTGEDPGLGPTGQAFVDALRGRLGGKSMDVYPVNYPASDQWSTGLDGIRDAESHVINEAGACPNTKMVLGGYSQGAAVAGFVTSSAVPDSVPQDVDPATIPKPLDPCGGQPRRRCRALRHSKCARDGISRPAQAGHRAALSVENHPGVRRRGSGLFRWDELRGT